MLRLSTREEFNEIYWNDEKKKKVLMESIVLKIWQNECMYHGFPVKNDLSSLVEDGEVLEDHPYFRYAESAIEALIL